MNAFHYSVSFRIRHPSIDTHEISTQLALKPHRSWTAGELRTSPKGKLLGGKREETYWSHTLTHGPETSLANCLERFSETLDSHAEFLKGIRASGGTIEYFIGWFSGHNGGEILTHRLLSKLSILQIDLAFDIYGAEPE
jgi:hypothetical protein